MPRLKKYIVKTFAVRKCAECLSEYVGSCKSGVHFSALWAKRKEEKANRDYSFDYESLFWSKKPKKAVARYEANM